MNGCVKPQCEPFKNWVTEVVPAIQQEGAYRLDQGEAAGVLSRSVAEAMVRLEERNLRIGSAFAATQREQQALLRELVAGVNRIAVAMEHQTAPAAPTQRRARSAADVLAEWRGRLTVTEDVWSVAAHLVPILLERGVAARSIESMATHTGLTQERVRDCLRFLQKRACIRQVGTATDGTPRYRLTER